VTRVDSEAEARAIVEVTRREYHDARHHCTAFVIGPDAALRRSNDDGEPAGTAGAPILEALSRREISDVVAVVTRWFGGTLLGAGGLVRAYGDAVGLALDEAGVCERALRHTMRVQIAPADAGVLDHRLRSVGLVTDVSYRESVEFIVSVIDPERFTAEVAGFSAGKAVVERIGSSWVDLVN
jgi:uncharacterized YigZ family protein